MLGEKETLVLSDRATVVVAELDAFELGKAEARADELIDLSGVDFKDEDALSERMMKGKMSNVPRAYAICSVREINGTGFKPLENSGQYSEVARRLGAREMQALMKWATPLYNPDDEEKKKGPVAAQSETPSS